MERRPEFARIRICLAGSVHFSSLSGEELDAIAELGRLVRLDDGQSVHRPGDPVSSFWIVLSGSLRITSSEKDGGEFVYALLGAGSFFGLGYLLADAPLGVSASAYGASEVAAISGERFVALCDNTPGLWRHVTKMMTRRLSIAMIALRDISNAPLSRRIVRRLAGQAVGRGADLANDARIELRVTQADLAVMLGASRSKVNAELKQLEADGLIEVGYRVIALRDLARLRALAGPDVFAF
jgi:CRP-like cAMP-binding protein